MDSERPKKKKNLREDSVDPKEKIIRDTLEDMMTSFKLVGSEAVKRTPNHSHKDCGFLSIFNSYMETR